jgi:hypothetical protein
MEKFVMVAIRDLLCSADAGERHALAARGNVPSYGVKEWN